MRLLQWILCSAVLLVAILVTPAAAQYSSVGLYTDTGGGNCSLADNAQGSFSAYVVVRPGQQGVSAVQFSAPVPSCFTGTYVGDQTVPGTLVIGNSQSGVSVVLTTCSAFTAHVLTIQYFGFGTTPPCCEYPVLPDPTNGVLAVVDCFYNTEAAAGVVSTINSDAGCACTGNTAPFAPDYPVPNDGEQNVSVYQALSWSAVDLDENITEYDIYLGTSPNPPLVAVGHPTATYTPDPMTPLAQYYWKVVVRDEFGLEATGPVWTFTTRDNAPPFAPTNPAPANGAADQPVGVTLEWTATDLDGDPLEYDVYFGDTPVPPLVASDLIPPAYETGLLAFATTYYWRVVARDPVDNETSGSVWSFTTRPANYPPDAPAGPSPPNAAEAQPPDVSLAWSASDPDADPLVFDVRFGTTPDPPLVATDVPQPNYAPGTLAFATTYYWRIVSRDDSDAETSGPLWHFTTRPANYPPDAPTTPSPPSGATDRPVSLTLAWQASDPDADTLSFDVYLGTSATPPLVASDAPLNSYATGTLAYATPHYWRIVARDSQGAETSGPTWTFTTRPANFPPLAPSSPSPAHNATSRPVTQTLAWQCSDPDLHAITYDVYFGTASPPPLVAGDAAQKFFAPGLLAFQTTYRWRIVARDELGAETSGPTWVFSTKTNSPPTTPSNPNPPNNGVANISPTLAWTSTDPDGLGLTFDVYFGASSPPPLVAAGHTANNYATGSLQGATQYYWQIVASDGIASVSGPTWTFVASPPGDVNLDGFLTLADAICAMEIYLGNGACGGTGGAARADVDCNSLATPRDARCIHKKVTDGSCTFCGEQALAPRSAALLPQVTVAGIATSGDSLIIGLAVSGIPSLEAFGFNVQSASGVKLYDAASPLGLSTVEARSTGSTTGRVGGYTLSSAAVGAGVEFVQITFRATAGIEGGVLVTGFVDDLEGSSDVNIPLEGVVAVTLERSGLVLRQNRPNPFNPQTTIQYSIPEGGASRIRLRIVDTVGRVVCTLVDGAVPPGDHEAVWDGRDDRGGPVSSGVYFYVLDAGGERRTRKLVLLK